MTTMMPADQAAKVLRNHSASVDLLPTVAAAIGAAVAALEHQPKPAYCCAKCGLAELHPRERALHQDAKRGNFRHQEDDGA